MCVLENLRAWMSKHNSSNWSLGVKLVQFQENSRNYLEQFQFMFDNKFPVELAETLMPFEALGCLKTKEELNQILEESISTGIENVHTALGGSSYGVMFGFSELSDGPKYHSLGRTRKKRLIYNGNFTIGKSKDNNMSDLSMSQISSEPSTVKQEELRQVPACIKGETPSFLDETDVSIPGDNGSALSKNRICKIKKSELKQFEILPFPKVCEKSDHSDWPENMNNEKLNAEKKSEINSNLRESLPFSDSLEMNPDHSRVNSADIISSDAIAQCQPAELKMKPVKDIIKFMESQCCKQEEKSLKPGIKIEKSCEFPSNIDIKPGQSNAPGFEKQTDLEKDVTTLEVGQPAPNIS